MWSRPSTARTSLHLLASTAGDCDTSEPHRGPSALVHPASVNQPLSLAKIDLTLDSDWLDKIGPAL